MGMEPRSPLEPPDFCVTTNDGETELFHNRHPAHRKPLAVRLTGKGGNPTAIGAAEDVMNSWNQLMSNAVAYAREVECRRNDDCGAEGVCFLSPQSESCAEGEQCHPALGCLPVVVEDAGMPMDGSVCGT